MKTLRLIIALFLFIPLLQAQTKLSLQDLEQFKTYEVHRYSRYKTFPALLETIQSDSIHSLLFHNQTSFPKHLDHLRHLKSLSLYSCEEVNYGNILNTCLRFNQLIELTISGISDQVFPKEIYQLQQLKKLTLAGNHYSSIPKGLSKLKQLEVLCLGDHMAGGNHLINFPKEILKLKNLRVLDLQGNQELQLDKHFYKLKWLEELNVSFVKNIDFAKMCQSFPKLKKLVLTGIGKTSWEGLSQLRSLEDLSMDYDAQLVSFGNDFSKLQHLKTLKVKLTGDLYSKDEIAKIAALPNLETLSIQIIGKQTTFLFPTEGFKQLKNLKVDNRAKINLEEIIDIVSQYKRLESLDLCLQWVNLAPKEKEKLLELSKHIRIIGLDSKK